MPEIYWGRVLTALAVFLLLSLVFLAWLTGYDWDYFHIRFSPDTVSPKTYAQYLMSDKRAYDVCSRETAINVELTHTLPAVTCYKPPRGHAIWLRVPPPAPSTVSGVGTAPKKLTLKALQYQVSDKSWRRASLDLSQLDDYNRKYNFPKDNWWIETNSYFSSVVYHGYIFYADLKYPSDTLSIDVVVTPTQQSGEPLKPPTVSIPRAEPVPPKTTTSVKRPPLELLHNRQFHIQPGMLTYLKLPNDNDIPEVCQRAGRFAIQLDPLRPAVQCFALSPASQAVWIRPTFNDLVLVVLSYNRQRDFWSQTNYAPPRNCADCRGWINPFAMGWIYRRKLVPATDLAFMFYAPQVHNNEISTSIQHHVELVVTDLEPGQKAKPPNF